MIDFTNYGFTKTEFLYAMILDTHLVSMDISIAEAKLAKVVNPKVIDFKTQKPTSVRIDAVELIDLLNESQETMKTAVDENKDSVDMLWVLWCSGITELNKDEVLEFINEARGEDLIPSREFLRFVIDEYVDLAHS